MSHKKHHTFTSITIGAQELKDKIETTPDLLVINVLNHETYVDCHIPGSINIEFDHLVENLAGLDKDKEIVLYCASNLCPKSNQAYELLSDLGFSNLYEYTNGMREWVKKGFSTTGMCVMQYLHE